MSEQPQLPARPLEGWRVVVTRSEEQADRLSRHLRAMGAEPVVYATIAFAPPEDPQPLDSAIGRLADGGYDWLVLTSVTGVRTVHERLTRLHADRQRPLTLPPALKLAVVGSATGAACAELLHMQPAVVPEKFVAESLAEAMGDMHRQRVLLANADISRPVLQEQLQQAGALVERVVAYRTVPASGGEIDLPALLKEGTVHAITFTSGSTVRYFVERIGTAALPAARQTVIACIGPITARAAEQAGLPPTIVAPTSTIEGLVEALVAWRQHR